MSLLKMMVPGSARNQLRRIEQLLKLPLLKGDKHLCPCCDKRFRKFLPFYGEDGVRCPYCNSLPRHRFQAFLILGGPLSPITGKSLLHFAPEFALNRMFRRMAPRNYVTADFMASFIPGICVTPDLIIDIRETKLPNSTFDLVICNHVLEHVDDDRKALKEIIRILSPDAKVIITVPVSSVSNVTDERGSIDTPELRARHFGSPDHVRLYGMDVVERFRDAGFDVDVCRPRDVLSTEIIEESVLDANEAHFLLSKSQSAG